MIRHKWILGVRNQLANFSMECDSAAAINGSKLTSDERECIQDKLRDIIGLIDRKLNS